MANLLLSQNNYQATRWAVQGYEIDFTSSTPQYSSLSTGTVSDCINSFTYTEGEMLFQIVDDEIRTHSGNFADYIGVSTFKAPEVAIMEEKNSCEDFLAFYITREIDAMFTTEKLCYTRFNYDNSANPVTIIDDNIELESFGASALGGIALSQEKSDGSRFLYYASTYNNGSTAVGFVKKYTIYANGTISSGTTIYTGSDGDSFRMAELELSHNGEYLAFSRLKTEGWSTDEDQDVVIFELNPTTGNLSNSTPIEINLNSNDGSVYYPGIEFGPNNAKLYVIASNSYLHEIDLSDYSSSYISIDSDFANSMLELGRDGIFYVASSDELSSLDVGDGTTTQFIDDNMAANSSLYISGHTVYVLPDQIDGQDYGTYINQESCCYVHSTSKVLNPMTGVTEETNGDITIESGNTVSWTTTINPFDETEIYMKGDLIIEPGARLNITGLTLHFKEDQEVQLSAGATSGSIGSKLYLYSGTKLTAFDECDSETMWEGIDVTGNWQYSQTGSAQPYLYMNNATVEYANYGVEAPAGGKVAATLSDFKDNVVDVTFSSYSSYDNTSYFKRCNFYTTDDLYTVKNLNPYCHAKMYYAPGILFEGCDFYNDYSDLELINPYYRGTGILSTHADAIVRYKCSSMLFPCPAGSTTRSTFTDLYFGIKADQGDSFVINRCDFNNCMVGAWIIGIDALTATENYFDVYDDATYDLFFGMYIESSTGYHVEQNEFEYGLVGLVVYNSGDDENLIYKNTFSEIDVFAFGGFGDNSGYGYSKAGLQLRCNEFENVDYAITVLGGDLLTSNGLVTVNTSDIRKTQGGNPHDISAYNYFYSISSYDFFINSSVSEIIGNSDKYQYNQTNSPGYYLQNYNSNHIDVEWYLPKNCPSTLLVGWGITPLMDNITGLNEQENNAEDELVEMLSYNQYGLLSSANTANSFSVGTSYNTLIEASPYLTSEILIAYLNNQNVSELSKVSLMLANSPLPEDVKDVLNNYLSPEYASYILQHQVGKNPIEQVQERISDILSAKQVEYDKLVRNTFANDTTPEFNDTYQMVLGFMENQYDIHAQKRLIKLYNHKGMYAKSIDVLSDMRLTNDYNDDTNLQNFVAISEIQIELLRTDSKESKTEIVNNYLSCLHDIAADYNTKEGGIARAILQSAEIAEYVPFVFMPNEATSNKSAIISTQEQSKPDQNISLTSLFNIYPNPANDMLSIEFINPDGSCTFNIYSIKGDLVKTVNSTDKLGFMSIMVSDLQPGNYIIECPQLQSKQQFVIER